MSSPLSKRTASARRIQPRAAVIGALCLCAALGSAAPTLAAAKPGPAGLQRGALVSATPLESLTAAQATAYVRDQGFPAPAAQDSVDLYRLTYRTVTPTGRATIASGLVTLPHSASRRSPQQLSTVEYTHGTLPYRGDAASVDDGADRAVSVMFAGAGFAAVAPDYLGLGLGTGPHPYMDIDSETTASVDMLKAARTFEAGKGVTMDGKVLATGFSQGATAALGLGRALQRGAVPGLRLGALAPVSGPYDLAGAELPAAFDGRLAPPTAAFYLAYAITAWNRLHPLYHSPAEAFRAPYASTVETLFDGSHTDEQIVAGLPGTPEELLTPQFIERLKHPTGALARIVRTDDAVCSDWAPKAPVRLYDGNLDRDVAVANTLSCQRSLAANGVQAPIVNAGDVDHFGSAHVSYPRILQWFQQLTAAHR
ncbi:alpha/beta hydrolase family protein [Streptacidiphilus sp. PAMC 29251]